METNSELDVINHLLEIEKGASSLINDAQIEADKRVSDAKAKYNADYKSKFDESVAQMEKDYSENIEALKKAHEAEIQNYKNELESGEKNAENFNKLLDKLLFA